jgi:hypothetical protein
MSYSDAPTRADLDRLIETLAPRIVRILIDLRVPDTEAERLISRVLAQLSYQWGRIADRERWLLQRIEEEARKLAEESRKELEDDEAPPRPET